MMIEASFGTFAPFDKLVRGIFAEQMHATTALFSRRAPLSCHKTAKAPEVHVDVHAADLHG